MGRTHRSSPTEPLLLIPSRRVSAVSKGGERISPAGTNFALRYKRSYLSRVLPSAATQGEESGGTAEPAPSEVEGPLLRVRSEWRPIAHRRPRLQCKCRSDIYVRHTCDPLTESKGPHICVGRPRGGAATYKTITIRKGFFNNPSPIGFDTASLRNHRERCCRISPHFPSPGFHRHRVCSQGRPSAFFFRRCRRRGERASGGHSGEMRKVQNANNNFRKIR